MSHYRTEIYTATKARLEGADLVAADRISIERAEPVTARTAAEAAAELPIINLAFQSGNRSRTTEAEPLKGTAILDVEIFTTGVSGQAAAAERDQLCEDIENLLLGDTLAWSSNRWKVTAVGDTLSGARDGDVLVSAAKLSFTLEIATVPTFDTEDMVEVVAVDVQTMEPDDETTEMSFTAEPEVEEA